MEAKILNILDIFEDIFDIFGDIIEGIAEFLYDKFVNILKYITNSHHALVYYLKCKLFYRHRVIIDSSEIHEKSFEPREEWSIENFGSEYIFFHAESYLSDRGYIKVDLHYNFKRRNDAIYFKMVWKI